VTYHGILHTSDDGQHWQDVTPWTSADYTFGGRTDELTSFTSGDRAWLVLPGRTSYVKVGQKQQPELARSFETSDGGQTWRSGTIPETDSTYTDAMSGAGFIDGLFGPLGAMGENRGQVSIDSLSVLDDQHAWVAVSKTFTHTGGGQESIVPIYSRIWQSSDGGKTWHLAMDEKPANNGSSTLDKGWITFLNGRMGLMGGPTPDTIRVSHNGGATWQLQQLPTPHLTPRLLQRSSQGQASFFDEKNGLISVRVLLDGQHTRVFAYITHDGAQTWQMSSMQTLDASGNAFYLNAQSWMLMNNGTALLETTDGGETWNTIVSKTGTAYLSNLIFVSQQEGWAIGRTTKFLEGSQYSQNDATTLLKTTDGGKTWVRVSYIVQA
jgi:photosystem II stability/assembly factor-like uncharacterized protein